jgi:histidinol-phosphate/aromatic aminotransferase/cobyric acid decarboxylase-like protein/choline kinase
MLVTIDACGALVSTKIVFLQQSFFLVNPTKVHCPSYRARATRTTHELQGRPRHLGKRRMRAVLLAAGYGQRMRPLTDTVHKTLLEVGGQTILGRIVTGLAQAGVTEILVVTGHRADEVEGYLREHHPGVRCRFVRNERYRETNNIHSLSLAFEHLPLDEDVILVESDVVCETAIFERIVKTPHANAALLDRYRAGMDGTVVTVEGGLITSVIPPHLQSGEFSFADKYKTLNIYKFSKEFCQSPFKKLLTHYATIDDSCYYELILGILIYLKKARISAEILQGERWAEIDDPNDLRVAEFTFSPGERRRILESTAGGYWSFDITDFCFIRNMYFPTPSMMAELRNNLAPLVHNYGSRQEVLNRKLAVFLLCTPERVNVLNGVSQVYPILAARFAGKRVLLPEPTFGEYRRSFPEHTPYPDRMGVDFREIERRAGAADVVVFVNPNNPTGTLLPTSAIFRFAEERPDLWVIVDESFLAFSDQPSIISLLERQPLPNVIVLASLSKSLGIPGVRLGHAYTCNAKLSADIARSLPIWNLNSIAEHVLEIALKHRPGLAASFQTTRVDRVLFAEDLARVAGVETVHPSGGNFLLVTLQAGLGPANAIVDRLLNRHALYVKDVTDRFPGERVHLRLAVRLPGENKRLCAALAEELRLAQQQERIA